MIRPLSALIAAVVLAMTGSPLSARADGATGSYESFVVDPARDRIGIYWKDPAGKRFGSIGKLKRSMENRGETLVFATNGGIFEKGYTPLGLYIENSKAEVPLNRQQGAGNFYLQPNGVFYIDGSGGHVVRTPDFAPDGSIVLATQSGPMLVWQGQINDAFRQGSDNKLIRSGVGIDKRNRIVFAISLEPISFYDFSKLFRDDLGCDNALFLDGVISRMYIAGTKRAWHDGDFASIIAVSRPAGSHPAQPQSP